MAKLILTIEKSYVASFELCCILKTEPRTVALPFPIEVMVAVTMLESETMKENETSVTGVMENVAELVVPPASFRAKVLGTVETGGVVSVPLSIARPKYMSGGAWVSMGLF